MRAGVSSKDKRVADYLAKAEEAEKFAKQTSDPFLKESWLKIAKSYRDLAKTT